MIRSYDELTGLIDEIGFLPLFANEARGFSLQEMSAGPGWWTGDPEYDPWVWRERAAADRQIAYGKFFGGKAGFISREWLPRFANARRRGYDFDALWQDGLAERREKAVMDWFIAEDENGDMVFKSPNILSTRLKSEAGFGAEGFKNYPGVITGLQMRLYLVIGGFGRRESKRGSEYGMPVSILLSPESIWGYDFVTSAYDEPPEASMEIITAHAARRFPDADRAQLAQLLKN